MRGTFVAVVGPSGAGKDTLIRAALVHRPDLRGVRRVVSRPAHDQSEDFESVTPDVFVERSAAGAFALTWPAHGLWYGIPGEVDAWFDTGQTVIANVSRGVVDRVRERFDPCRIIVVDAVPEVLACRLAARGRETAAEIAERLRRAPRAMPSGPDVRVVRNDNDLPGSVAAFLAALPPVIAHVPSA